jgi:hypothetical protein
MRKPDIPDAFADPLFGPYHQFEGAASPDEGLGRNVKNFIGRQSTLVVKGRGMGPADSPLGLNYEGVNRYWRPLVVMAQCFQRPKVNRLPLVIRCKKRSGKLQGLQLDLFESFYRPEVPVRPTPDPARPLADLFPEAYGN